MHVGENYHDSTSGEKASKNKVNHYWKVEMFYLFLLDNKLPLDF